MTSTLKEWLAEARWVVQCGNADDMNLKLAKFNHCRGARLEYEDGHTVHFIGSVLLANPAGEQHVWIGISYCKAIKVLAYFPTSELVYWPLIHKWWKEKMEHLHLPFFDYHQRDILQVDAPHLSWVEHDPTAACCHCHECL